LSENKPKLILKTEKVTMITGLITEQIDVSDVFGVVADVFPRCLAPVSYDKKPPVRKFRDFDEHGNQVSIYLSWTPEVSEILGMPMDCFEELGKELEEWKSIYLETDSLLKKAICERNENDSQLGEFERWGKSNIFMRIWYAISPKNLKLK
jgi:hypothetical protein